MDQYTQKIKIVLDKDASSFQAVSDTLAAFSKQGFMSPEKSEKFNNDLKTWKDTFTEINYLQQQLNSLQGVHIEGIEEVTKALQEQIDLRKQELGIEDDAGPDQKQKKDPEQNPFLKRLKKIGMDFLNDAWDLIKKSVTELNTLLQASRLTDAQTRQTMFRYGFTQAEAYGYQKALGVTGVGSLEELLQFGTESERRLFQEAFTKYTNKYSELYDKGFFTQLLEYNAEMEQFKQDVTLEVVQFIVDNKNEIMLAMKAMIKLSEFTITALGWIVKHWGGGSALSESEKAAAASEAVRSYVTNNSSKTATINQYNSFNGVNPNDASWAANLSQLSYQATIKAMG